MNKNIGFCITLLIANFYCQASWAENNNHLHSKISVCAKTVESAERLSCFDKLAEKLANKTDSASKIVPNQNEVKSISSHKESLKSAPVKPTKVAQPEQPIESIEAFGKQHEDKVEAIESRLIGEFKRWKKGQKLNLENGQTWIVKRANSGYKKLQNPKIIISQDLFGGYKAKIEGLNSTAKVSRIK